MSGERANLNARTYSNEAGLHGARSVHQRRRATQFPELWRRLQLLDQFCGWRTHVALLDFPNVQMA